MANHGFGAGGFNADGHGQEEFAALARRYWNAWGEMMRAGGAPSAAGVGMPGFGMPGFGAAGAGVDKGAMPGWNDAIAWWSKLAQGSGGGAANETLDRFSQQASGWYAQMQDVAARFAGRDGSAADITRAWKDALGGGNVFADAIRGMQGPGQHGFEQWGEQVKPWLDLLQRGGRDWAGTPAFGFAREHQQRWQKLARAHDQHQQANQAHHAMLGDATQRAFELFEQKLAERSEPGRQIGSARALFDLWIDAAEEAYAEIALSPRFRASYGELVNTQMQLRAAVQGEVEQAAMQLGMPTRTEVDAAHRKIVQLERELRRLRDAVQGLAGNADSPRAATAPPPRTATADTPAKRAPAAAQTSGRKASAKKAPMAPAAKPASGKQTASRAPAAKPARGKPLTANATKAVKAAKGKR
ncbi:poly(R)-hydroxyalkanoic acid synthase subunit PhaE [Montanilutibacter psychrotolerans]|uniref:Poly(3-hydroxyalkanoate) polymerase subunit PhaE n=1 Tax=Montanilutibacter psychrotolerans TaxID=1327343 RepID=A0A3M8SWR0_9GAMM|nr:poly(R)-hydroxyalkanoic acid synthase subunit PhaE [Lysobacter psychrotolerans]RNF85253.1 class III poly(R)-hydroxyalkanoic acid synthase subunit PhaE [Lysobacter psychrotolerans]